MEKVDGKVKVVLTMDAQDFEKLKSIYNFHKEFMGNVEIWAYNYEILEKVIKDVYKNRENEVVQIMSTVQKLGGI